MSDQPDVNTSAQTNEDNVGSTKTYPLSQHRAESYYRPNGYKMVNLNLERYCSSCHLVKYKHQFTRIPYTFRIAGICTQCSVNKKS